MKISGYTVIRNAGLMGYPVQESIRSLLPLVDELVIGVGQSEDNTKEIIAEIGDDKIKTFDSHWDLERTRGGLILSEKSNEALEHCSHEWCFYLQADEVLHEDDIPKIRAKLEEVDRDPKVQGLLLQWHHFYGSYDVVATAKNWYRHEMRCVRKSSGAKSFGDAQGFRLNGMADQPVSVVHSGARVFHYGWVKPPQTMGRKKRMLDFWWHGQRENNDDQFHYDSQYGLRPFEGEHPQVMKKLIAEQDWKFQPKRSWNDWNWKEFRYWLTDVYERTAGYRPGELKHTKCSPEEALVLGFRKRAIAHDRAIKKTAI